MNDIKLKACPFCGGDAMTEEVDAIGAIRKSIGCHTEGCHGYQSTQTYSTYREAAKAWNVRAGVREQEAKPNAGDIAGSLEQPGYASCKHDHACHCGTATHAPHETGTEGCVRYMTEAPEPKPGERWYVDGHEITDYTLKQQRGYHQHPCGCWSRWPGSSNSIEA